MKDQPIIETDCFGVIAIGLAVMFICLGIGGCSYLLNKGEAEREKVKQEQPK